MRPCCDKAAMHYERLATLHLNLCSDLIRIGYGFYILRLFLQPAGWPALASGQKWTCTFANDFDEVKATAYRGYHGGLALVAEDVRHVKSKELRDAANLSRPSPAIFKLAFPGLVSSASVAPSFELCS